MLLERERERERQPQIMVCSPNRQPLLIDFMGFYIMPNHAVAAVAVKVAAVNVTMGSGHKDVYVLATPRRLNQSALR